jgi:hypothetical protein
MYRLNKMNRLSLTSKLAYNSGLFHKQELISPNVGLFYCHQGWTDIINCLSLINICAKRNDTLYMIFREDAKTLIDYYIQGLKNVIPIYVPKVILETTGPYEYIKNLVITNYEFFGEYDSGRTDRYKNSYSSLIKKGIYTFEQLFYISYDIPYHHRSTEFAITRNTEAEDTLYNKLVTDEPYICTHTNPELELFVTPNTDYKKIELNKSSEIFFDMIRVLENSKEIHVIDSVWASICYLIDCRYGLFQNIPIYVYCHRGFHRMFEDPRKLSNWNIIV